MRGRHREQKTVVEQTDRFDVGMFDRQREQQHIELTIEKFAHEGLGLALANMQIKVRKRIADHRQQLGQHIRRDRRDHTKTERTGENLVLLARDVDNIAHVGQHPRRALCDFLSAFRQHHPAPAAFEKLDPEEFLELLDLHRKRRLGHGAVLRGLAEMARPGDGIEVFELFERDHVGSIFLIQLCQ